MRVKSSPKARVHATHPLCVICPPTPATASTSSHSSAASSHRSANFSAHTAHLASLQPDGKRSTGTNGDAPPLAPAVRRRRRAPSPPHRCGHDTSTPLVAGTTCMAVGGGGNGGTAARARAGAVAGAGAGVGVAVAAVVPARRRRSSLDLALELTPHVPRLPSAALGWRHQHRRRQLRAATLGPRGHICPGVGRHQWRARWLLRLQRRRRRPARPCGGGGGGTRQHASGGEGCEESADVDWRGRRRRCGRGGNGGGGGGGRRRGRRWSLRRRRRWRLRGARGRWAGGHVLLLLLQLSPL